MQLILLFASLLGGVAAKSLCYTRLAAKAGPAKLATTTTTSTPGAACTQTVTQYTTYFTTVTPVTRVTSTKTATVTGSGSVTTITVSPSTSTTTSTDVVSTTTFLTSTTTTTASTSTSTVPTLSGFVPVQSSLPGSSWNGTYGPGGPDPAGSSKRKRSSGKGPKNLNPQAVRCLEVAAAQCTNTAVSISTITATATNTRTRTRTTTTTLTLAPSATGTSTVTVTPTTTSTTTTTTTVTSTLTATSTVVPLVNAYEVCATNNFADLVGGAAIQLIIPTADYSANAYGIDYIGTDNVYDCCVAGLMDYNAPGAFEFIYQYDGTTNYCYFVYPEPGYPQGYETTLNQTANPYTAEVPTNPYYNSVVGNYYYGLINSSTSTIPGQVGN